jgi:hypothetical protein
LEFLYKSHLVVLSGNIKKCSFQSAIKKRGEREEGERERGIDKEEGKDIYI